MKTKLQILVAASAVAIGMVTWPVASGDTKEVSQTQKIDQLLKERRDTLQRLVEVVTAEYRQGRSGFESVARATDQLIDAELELAKNAETRITILQRRVDLMKELFTAADMQLKEGLASQAQVLAAQAALLDSQIQLARERPDGGEPKQ